MKTAICFLYVLFLLVYFILDYSRVSGLLYTTTQSLLIGYLAYSLSERLDYHEELILKAVAYLSLANFTYTIICFINGKEFAMYNTDVFAYIAGISFVYILTHIAYIKGKT